MGMAETKVTNRGYDSNENPYPLFFICVASQDFLYSLSGSVPSSLHADSLASSAIARAGLEEGSTL